MKEKELVETIRKACKGTFWEILDEELLPILSDYADGIEAVAVNLKRQISELTKAQDKSKWKWDTSKIKWIVAEGFKGKYERSEDVTSPDFKNLVRHLSACKGKLSREGYFYWLFENGVTVGRKKRG